MRQEWLKEELFAGQTANGFKLGTAMSLGWFWTRVNGCRLVYRGESMGRVDFDEVLVAAGPEADEIVIPDFVSHEPGKDYFYVVRCANRCGRIERTLNAAVKVSINSAGELEAARPNGIFGLAIKHRQDGQVELVWHYCPIEQASEPEEMRIYSDEGTGQIDYQEPVALMPYKGRRFYQHKNSLSADGRYRFAVRAADGNGNEHDSTKFIEIETLGRSVEAIEIVGVI